MTRATSVVASNADDDDDNNAATHDDDDTSYATVTPAAQRQRSAVQRVPLLSSSTATTHEANSATTSSLSPYANRNVRCTIAYNFVDGACVSVWSAQLLPLLVTRDASAVTLGTCMMASGVAQIAGAAVAAACASRTRSRAPLLRATAATGAVAVLGFLCCLQYSVRAMVAAQAVWGVYVGAASTVTEALFADSVPAAQRAAVYNVKWIVQTLCYEVGYAFALVMLLVYGNAWSDASIRAAMRVGLAVQPVAFVLLLCLDEAHTLPANAQHELAPQAPTVTAVDHNDGDNNNNNDNNNDKYDAATASATMAATAADVDTDDHVARVAAATAARDVDTLDDNNNDDAASLHAGRRLCAALRWLVSWSAVPYVVCLVDLLMAIGSGMSLPFFAPFFAQSCRLTPVQMYVMYMVSTCTTALVAHAVRALADGYTGRLPAVLVTRAVGITALLCLSLVHGDGRTPHDDDSSNSSSSSRSHSDDDSRRLSMAYWLWLALLFVLRNSCMNAVLGLTRSVIMDAVRRENRAKWSAFESFSSFTWSGSAILGGYMAEAHSYQYTFKITALVHYVALAILAPAIVGARRVEQALMRAKQEKAAARKAQHARTHA